MNQSGKADAPGLAHRLDRWLWQLPWPDRQRKRRVFKRLQRRGENLDFRFNCDFFGLSYEGTVANNIDLAVYFYGAFEKPLLFFLRDAASALRNRHSEGQPPQFFDVGANVGQHSLYMSKFCRQVHAFEPFATVGHRLLGQLALNDINNVRLHEVGLGQQSDSLPFFAPSGGNQGIGSFDANTIDKGNIEAGRLQVVNGDEFVKQHGLGPIDLMKMDVEGFEKHALAGLAGSLERWRPLVVVEISFEAEQSFQSLDDLRDTLPADYELFELNGVPSGSVWRKWRSKRARHNGAYWLQPFGAWPNKGQADLVACPAELLPQLPGHKPESR